MHLPLSINPMMSPMSKREYLIQLKKKYWKSDRRAKTRLLNDFCDFTKYNRKYAIDLIRKPFKTKWKRKNRRKIYNQPVIDKLLILWRASNEICGERFQPYIPTILKKLKECGEIKVSPQVEEKLLRISMGSVKNIFRRTRRRSGIRISTTRPGSILKKHITIRYGRWKETDPGWCELDTVSHCGGDPSGDYVSSLNITDIATGWTEPAAIWGKGERETVAQVENIRKRVPFQYCGFDPDNGSEFINWHMYRYCRKNRINFTRGRPYYKNDNAHIEQKNYPVVRQLVGYGRLDRMEQKEMLNDLYAGPWRLYLNFFQPSLKLKEVVRNNDTGKIQRRYLPAATPYQRMLDHPKVSRKQKLRLICQYQLLNPIKLQEEINRKVARIKRTVRSDFK